MVIELGECSINVGPNLSLLVGPHPGLQPLFLSLPPYHTYTYILVFRWNKKAIWGYRLLSPLLGQHIRSGKFHLGVLAFILFGDCYSGCTQPWRYFKLFDFPLTLPKREKIFVRSSPWVHFKIVTFLFLSPKRRGEHSWIFTVRT